MFDLQNYNEEQRQALCHEKGPLLIIAGAGTGKTNVLTGRILYLLQEKKVDPAHILALTFTEKATQEMLQRIDKELPLSYEELWIKTFHGFCDAVLRDCALDIGLSPDYRLLSEADQWMLMKKNIFLFDLDYYRPLGNPSKFIRALLSHFSRLKDENITPEVYRAYADSLKNKVKSVEEKLEFQKTSEVARAYETYEQLLLKENALDYGGLIQTTLRLFQARKNVLQRYQKQFQHILVDEFQDTNFAQNQLLLLLALHHKNLFVVGDDDQSIYKWRGASVANILAFEKYFPDAKKIVLSKNYRSPQNILDVSYRLIQDNNPNRLEVQHRISKSLVATHSEKGNITLRQFDYYLEEIEYVVSQIQKLKKDNRDTAILIRANHQAKPFLEAFRRADMAHQHYAPSSVFSHPRVRDLLALLRFLARPEDDAALFRLLSMPFLEIPMNTLIALNQDAKRRYLHLSEYLLKLLALPAGVEKVIVLLKNLMEFSRLHSVSEVLGKFLEESGYGKILTKEETVENVEAMETLARFSSLIKEFEAASHEPRVMEFIEYLDLLQDAGEVKSSAMEIDREVPKILTLHAAKGLEFDTVFLPHLSQGKFPSIARSEQIEIPNALISEILPEGDHHCEEERRLFYVGLTRAKQNLFLTCSERYEGPKLFKPSPFFSATETALQTKAKKTPARSNEDRSTFFAQKNTEPRTHRAIPSFVIRVDKLSYSQFDTFATCPLKYKFRYLFRIPSPMSSAANFGSSLHNALKAFYHELQQKSAPALFRLRELFEHHWIPYGYENKTHERERKKQGWKVLQTYFDAQKKPFIIPEFLERNFKLKIGSIGLEGRIDRIDKLDDGTFEVIDYKTGTSKQKQNIEKDLQLSLYALACRDALKLPVSKLSLYYLEENRKSSTVRTDEQMDAVKKEVQELAKALQASDFSPTPGFHCSFCDYRTICNAAMVNA